MERLAGKKTVVKVAAAILLKHRQGNALHPETSPQDIDFLLAQRPAGKVYAGYWEFPGGKVEPQETIKDALVRELQEEMGITVTKAVPWLHKEFVYPHAAVHLSFWRVTAWDGEIGVSSPLEHSAISWTPLSDAVNAAIHLAPILPANNPVLKGLSLPHYFLISQTKSRGIEAELARIKRVVQHGGLNAMLQIREHDLSKTERQAFIRSAIAISKASCVPVVLNVRDDADLEQAKACGCHGVHLSSIVLSACEYRPNFEWVGASCHDAKELAQAATLGLDYAVLGPVQKTQTHPATTPLGWDKFTELVKDNRLPVYALGGLTPQHLNQAWQAGAHGIAMMRGW